MKNFSGIEKIYKLKLKGGACISDSLKEALELAKKHKRKYLLKFNGVEIEITEDSDLELISQKYFKRNL